MDEILNIKSPDKRFNAYEVNVYDDRIEGTHPYVVRTSKGNGIKGYIAEDEKYLSPAGSISFGQDTATAFYQDEPYFTGDKIKVLTSKDGYIDKYMGVFLASAIRKACQNLEWGLSSFDEDVLKSIEIMLPSSDGISLDYRLMKGCIRALEKVAIKEVIQLKDEIIERTKNIVIG